MKSFDEARKTAEELKSLIEKGINTKELRWYEYILGLIEFGKKNYRQAADLFGKACGRLDFESEWTLNRPPSSTISPEPSMNRETWTRLVKHTKGLRFSHPAGLMDGDLYAKAFYMLGKIAEQQGDKPRAREKYRKFLDLWKDADPGLPEVPDAKARLAALGT